MKFFVVLLALVAAVAAVTDEQKQAWEDWKAEHGKEWDNPKKEAKRMKQFLKRAAAIEAHNAAFEAGEETYKKSLNPHSHLPQDEFLAKFTGLDQPPEFRVSHHGVTLRGNPPASVDLRSNAGVGPVKNQNPCGDCWAFSTCSSLEYAYWKKNGKTIDLSEQWLVDCVYPNDPKGCNRGGWISTAMDYVAANGGIPTEAAYPIAGTQNSCKNNMAKAMTLPKTNTWTNFANDDNTIKTALATQGVLSVAVDATGWNNYDHGIFQSPNAGGTLQCNHGVALVGYGTENNVPYWIIRNQWGNTWFGAGEKIPGYIRLDARRNANGNVLGGVFLNTAYWPNM